MVKTRVLFGSAMIALLLAVLFVDQWFAPFYPFYAVAIFTIVWLAGREMGRMVSQISGSVSPLYSGIGCVAIVGANWPCHLSESIAAHFPNFSLPFFVFVALGMITFLGVSSQYTGPGDSVLRVEGYLLVFFYVGCLGSFIIQIRWMGGDSAAGALAFFIAVFSAKLCDTGAFFTGRALGRHKMAPTLSPGKTWEGAVGGVASGVLLALAADLVGEWMLGYRLLPLWLAALFGLCVAVAAMLGDLMESLVKRDCRQKDSSAKIPGFGGLLDVIDSILFSGPVAYAFFRMVGL
jgi:phosphatidate cytidylyltransferase